MPRIDLNCDLGEGGGNDAALLDVVTSANIACGAHAGDLTTMRSTVEMANVRGIAIGAHPGFPDREGFGRRPMQVTPDEVQRSVTEQIEGLLEVSGDAGATLSHVKPHGALYNIAATEPDVAYAIAVAVQAVDPGLVLFGLSGSELVRAGERAGLRIAAEGFADRAYEPDGTLVSRAEPDAVIHDPATAVAQAVRLATEGRVRARDGSDLELRVDTICVHGDSPNAVAIARALREGVEAAGVDVIPLSREVGRPG